MSENTLIPLVLFLRIRIFQHVHRQRQMMWLLQPTGRSSDTWKQPAMCGSARNFCMVGTRGVTDARSCPVVSFWGTQGSSAEELHHTSICHHRSFDCKCVGTFCQHHPPLLLVSGQWPLLFRFRVWRSNQLTESHGQGIADSTQCYQASVTLKTLSWTKAIWPNVPFTH